MVTYSPNETKLHESFPFTSNTAALRELAKQGTNAVLIIGSSIHLNTKSTTKVKDKNTKNDIEELIQLGFVQKLIVTSSSTNTNTNSDNVDHTISFIKNMAKLYDQIATSSFLNQFYPNEDTQSCETILSPNEVVVNSEIITEEEESHRLQTYEDNSVKDGIKSHFTFKLWSYKVPQS